MRLGGILYWVDVCISFGAEEVWRVVFGDGGWWAKRVVLFFPFLVCCLFSCGQDRMSHGFCRGEGRGGMVFFWGG